MITIGYNQFPNHKVVSVEYMKAIFLFSYNYG